MKTTAQIYSVIESRKARSAWSRAVKSYAVELVEACELDQMPTDRDALKKELLSGAADWSAFSSGGCSLIYDADICKRLCSPSEIKKTRNGERQPNNRETWIDCQARALGQAFSMIYRAVSAK